MARFVAAIDQGTTSTRVILFDRDGQIAALDQREHEQIHPQAGWVEHDPLEIWQRTQEVIAGALAGAGATAGDIAAIGITNQRETAVLWDRETGEPLHNAIVWQDTRTAALVRELAGEQGPDRLRERCRAAALDLLLGPEGRVDARLGARRARARRGRRAGLRHDRHLAAVEPDGRRSARDRRDQREPHDADGPADARLARAEPRADRHPALAAARDPLLERALRRGRPERAGRPSARRDARRPAGGAVRPDVLRGRATRRTPTAPARSCS